MLVRLMGDKTARTAPAHHLSSNVLEQLPAKDKSRKLEMTGAAFGSTLHSLQRAYSKLLHEAYGDQCSSEVAASVRKLADTVIWKVRTNCCESAEDGGGLMEELLEYLQVQFKYERIL